MNGKKVKALRKLYSIDKEQKVSKHLKATVNAQARTNAAQQPKACKARVNRPSRPHPKESSAWKRHGPVIVIHPVRAAMRKMLGDVAPDPKTSVRYLTLGQRDELARLATTAKHYIDSAAA